MIIFKKQETVRITIPSVPDNLNRYVNSFLSGLEFHILSKLQIAYDHG